MGKLGESIASRVDPDLDLVQWQADGARLLFEGALGGKNR